MRNLVLRSFKGRKRELRISIIILTLIYMCGITTILFQESFYRSRENLRYETYGEWMGAVFGAGEGTEQLLNEMDSIKCLGKIIMLGSAWTNGERIGEAGYIDQTAVSLSQIHMEEGEMPSTDEQIALSETAVNRLPKRLKVGDKIEITLGENEMPQSYTVSGIVKPWGRKWMTEKHELPSVIIGNTELGQGGIHFLFQNENPNDMGSIQTQLELLGEGTYVYNEKAYPLDISVLDEFFQDGKFVFFIVLFAAILIGYLVILTQKSRKYRLTILRGLGANAKEVVQLALWESTFLWGISFLAGLMFSVFLTGAVFYVVYIITKIPIHLELQIEFILEYIVCVTMIYFICNLIVALTSIWSPIRTTFKSDSGILDRSVPPKLKKSEKLTFFVCLKRKWMFYNKFHVSRFVISIIVMVVSAICLQLFIEAKNKYELWMNSIEYAYHYQANDLSEGLTEEQVKELEEINGVKSVEKEIFVNSSTMQKTTQEIRISAPAFQNSEYVYTHRKYSQKNLGVPVDEEGDYFSMWELRGIGPQDEIQLSYYEKAADFGVFDKEAFLTGEECVLLLPPYQIRDLGAGKEPVYVDEEMDRSKKVYTYKMDENAIAPGDMVKISTPWGEREIRVGTILTSSKSDLSADTELVAVSEKFINQLCGIEDTRYAFVKINLEETMDTASIGAEIEGYFEMLGKGANLTDDGSVMRGIAEESLFDGTQYLFILTIVWLVYMMIMYHGNQTYLKNEGKRIGVLRALGMDRKTLKLRYLLENLSEGGMAILLSFGIVTGEFLIRLRKEAPYDSINVLARALTDNPEKIRLFIMALFIAVVVFLGVSVVTLYTPLKKLSGRSIAENLGDGERR